MKTTTELESLPDDELLRRLAELLRHSRRTEADLVAHIGEVDARRLYAREASPSMFAYCTERLHLSEAEAYLRIAAARASREHPALLEMLADGRLHLTAIAKLAPHLTPQNREALLERAARKSKREVEDLVAELAPRPDAPAMVRKLPGRRVATRPVAAPRVESNDVPAPATRVAPSTPLAPTPSTEVPLAPGQDASTLQLRLDAVRSVRLEGVGGSGVCGVGDRTPRSAAVQVLAPARYRVQFTASTGLRDKLERLRALMRSSVPNGDLAAITDAAVTEKLERLEARRFGRIRAAGAVRVTRSSPPSGSGRSGKTGRGEPSPGRTRPAVGGSATAAGDSAAMGREPVTPGEDSRVARRDSATARSESASGPKEPRSTGSVLPAIRHIPAAVRRAVHERDGRRCRYVDGQGRRCTAREGLEFHHRRPFGHGGDHSAENIALVCRAHNRYHAEVDFGRAAMARHSRRQTGVPAATPSPSP